MPQPRTAVHVSSRTIRARTVCNHRMHATAWGGGLEQGPEGETQYERELVEGVGRLIVRGLLRGVVHGMGKLSQAVDGCKG